MCSDTGDSRKVDGAVIRPAVGVMTSLIFRHLVSQCLYTFVKIGVPDAMGGEALTPPEIATRLKTSVNVEYLARILRLLSSEGVLTEHKSDVGGAVYSLTDAGKLLQTDVPEQPSFSAYVELQMGPAIWKAWAKLNEAIILPTAAKDDTNSIGNDVPFEVENGMGYFLYIKEHQEQAKVFSKAMDSHAAEIPTVLKYDWKKLNGKTVVDLGGGSGMTMENVANAFPDIEKCISLDTPDIIRMAPKPRNKNVELVAGDFFESSTIPRCDAVFLKHILHNWNDAMAKRIIKACHEALDDGGLLIIGERVVAEIGDTSPDTILAKGIDILMMVVLGGRERSAKEWETLVCADSLFELDSPTPSKSDLAIFSFVKT